MKFHSVIFAAIFLSAQCTAHADTFSFNFVPLPSYSDPLNFVSFNLNSAQAPSSFGPATDGFTFYYTNVPVFSNGITYTREVGFGQFAGDFNGSYPYAYELGVGQNVIVNVGEIATGTVGPIADLLSYTPFFTGSPGAPVFIPGVYSYPNDGILTITDQTPTVTPEPSTFALLGTGLLSLTALLRKRIA